MGPVLVIAEPSGAKAADSTLELLAKGREVADAFGLALVAVGFGAEAREALGASGADEVVCVLGPAVEGYRPHAYEQAAVRIAKERRPFLTLLANTTMGMDLGAGVAARLGLPMVAYCTALSVADGTLVATSQVYGGKLLAEVEVPEAVGALVTVVPGSWPASAPARAIGSVAEVEAEDPAGLSLVAQIQPETGGGVDITRADVLVSVGRGIDGEENIELASEFADAIGGVVSCTRPIVDAGWLPRSRQVGKSGQTVKPKLYLALGVSGAPEHLQGMKDAELIVAVNTDASAPIFEVAHYGATVDILELLPILTERVGALGGN